MQPELIDTLAVVRAATEQISNERVETEASGGEFVEHHGCDLKARGELTTIHADSLPYRCTWRVP